MAPKSPTATDRYIGSRVRARRMLVGLSQEKLGEALGVTFQQVQKYEKGTNRIGASRLHQIAAVLGVPVDFFYEGAPGDGSSVGQVSVEPTTGSISEILSTAEGLQLIRAFMDLKDRQLRRSVVQIVTALAATEQANGQAHPLS